MKLILIATLIGNLTITSYRPVPEQTDSTPFITANGDRVKKGGVALSRNLLQRWGGVVKYGDTIYIDELGFFEVNDTMNKRHVNWADVFVWTLDEEKRFHKKYGINKRKVWLIKAVK